MAAYWKIAAHSAYDMFSKYKYLIVNLFFSRLGFWSRNIFLIAPFPSHCLLVPFQIHVHVYQSMIVLLVILNKIIPRNCETDAVSICRNAFQAELVYVKDMY